MNGTGKLMMMIQQRKCERSVTVLHLKPLDMMGEDGKSLRSCGLGCCEEIQVWFLNLFIA
jgi:hypothetical protein